jgi:hypothetical protein
MKHIGATYEPIPKQRDVSVTAQALTARFCDNYEYSGEHLDINLRPLHYCDKGAIEQYVEWFNNDCDFVTSKYKSQRISSNGKGKVSSKATKVNSKIISGIINSNINDEPEKEPEIIKRKTFQEIKDYYNNNLKDKLKGTGPRKPKPDEETGYYKATIRSNTKVYSYGEIYNERKHGLNETNYRFYPCYEFTTNKDTLEFWLIHYK